MISLDACNVCQTYPATASLHPAVQMTLAGSAHGGTWGLSLPRLLSAGDSLSLTNVRILTLSDLRFSNSSFLSAGDTSPAYYSLCTSRVFVNLFSLHVSSAAVKVLVHCTLRPQPPEFFLAHCTFRPQPPQPAQPAAESATVKLPS